MTSSRLPGKVLMEVEGKPKVKRLRCVPSLEDTHQTHDAEIIALNPSNNTRQENLNAYI